MAPFSSRDYEGKKSELEYGFSISPATIPKLRPYLFQSVLPDPLSEARPSVEAS